MHDLIFENQDKITKDGIYSKFAEKLDLDVEQFEKDLEQISDKRIAKDMKNGKEVRVKGTPTVFINGVMLVGAQPYSKFEEIIEAELKDQ
jgi:protein-disulfide isomerase